MSGINRSRILNVYRQKTNIYNALLICVHYFQSVTIINMSLSKSLSESYTRYGVIFLSHPQYSRYNKLSQPHSLPVSDSAGSDQQQTCSSHR